MDQQVADGEELMRACSRRPLTRPTLCTSWQQLELSLAAERSRMPAGTALPMPPPLATRTTALPRGRKAPLLGQTRKRCPQATPRGSGARTCRDERVGARIQLGMRLPLARGKTSLSRRLELSSIR
ncbi:hypothetical protein BRADI_5g17132v3 [Brachypodium distachyon]|uniref:Uncharacterized protein n=1 Tax=Brachypodium distachyon TaxID=15368 RepID=A0A0Q3EBU2_BRADI|nr:hypothetical protein BRADI_5g17132v3 [Brachypodium distachyon]